MLMTRSSSPTDGLATLSAQVHEDLAKIRYATGNWNIPVQKDGKDVLDVAIIGGGQGGLTACFGLRRQGVTNTQIFERAAKGGEGPWVTFARMITLRTPKHVTGPDLGVPNLTPQSWYEARYGKEAWQSLDKISRHDWQSYLDWVRNTLELPVVNDQELVHVEWTDGLLRLTFRNAAGVETKRWARRMVLATGIDGGGAWFVPPFISENLPKSVYAHTHEAIDFEALKGKRIGVLGAGASAFDNAATALESGVGRVDLCLRRTKIPAINPYRWMENAGFLAHFSELPDLTRWRFMRCIYNLNQPPPQDTFWRCRKHENFAFHPGTPWNSARMDGDEVVVETPNGEMRFDFLIIGTGFSIDLKHRPETQDFADSVMLWSDHFTAPEGEESTLLSSHPYLGQRFQFLPKDPADPKAPMLAAIYNFTFASMPSMGLSGASISGMRFGVEKLTRGIARDLFVEDGEKHLESLLSYDTEELISLDPPTV
ncbi:SidA/IucD/PvdA family monooxygenase [Gluconobacter cerinus]|uniref:SidA/IucD/PvdA family monooxygenase n=1 Tax=Gluconobacter cerinus TaxID=38307 RepID=UPI001B8B5965|nr:NAD(P)/FAD-dependent oxidoreductase [Gluconobacter cerinus]MBS1067996.1 NAD(P)/FAD-dependent oxidoreductase [Gluconobacter cerinus]